MIEKLPKFAVGRFDAVAIGSSTGAPQLVAKMIAGLPADLPLPIFIAQHLPLSFTESFARQMDRDSALTVVHAEDDMPVFPGTVYVGRGKLHMRVKRGADRSIRVSISAEPVELVYRPSVDELFGSCASVYGRKVLGIVMTGIGRDGLVGAGRMTEAGGVVLTQNRESCAVFGMPRACVEANLSSAELDPEGLRRSILQLSPAHHGEARLAV
jgi:two-component system chemotaxis response regulator CheB